MKNNSVLVTNLKALQENEKKHGDCPYITVCPICKHSKFHIFFNAGTRAAFITCAKCETPIKELTLTGE